MSDICRLSIRTWKQSGWPRVLLFVENRIRYCQGCSVHQRQILRGLHYLTAGVIIHRHPTTKDTKMSSGFVGSAELGLNTKRTAVTLTGLPLLALSFQTLGKSFLQIHRTWTWSFLVQGIIYSDIGTSPLYVLNGIWPAAGPVPSKEDVIGGVSAIIWSLTLLPLLKYVRCIFKIGLKH